MPDHQGILAAESDNIDVDAIRRHADEAIKPLNDLSRETFGRWIERFELTPKLRRLPSR